MNLKAKLDPNAFDGTGGLCFAIFNHDFDLDTTNDTGDIDDLSFPTREFRYQIDQLLLPEPGVTRTVDKISFTLLVGEPVLDMLTRVYIDWEIEESGHIVFDLNVTSRQYKIDILGIIM